MLRIRPTAWHIIRKFNVLIRSLGSTFAGGDSYSWVCVGASLAQRRGWSYGEQKTILCRVGSWVPMQRRPIPLNQSRNQREKNVFISFPELNSFVSPNKRFSYLMAKAVHPRVQYKRILVVKRTFENDSSIRYKCESFVNRRISSVVALQK